MKISICIPQYNRIDLLIKSLKIIEEQTYSDIEIVISDDCSTDDTEAKIKHFRDTYKFPIVYHKNEVNLGYDRNYRKSIELANGEYCFVIGNDDSLCHPNDILYLVNFLASNKFPDIGFCNYVEENKKEVIVERTTSEGVLGEGIETAIKYFNCFSFVGGLIYKKSKFMEFNTNKHDGSIYSQMYLGLLMISSGCTLFSIRKPLVLKDIHNDDGTFRWSYYRDGLPKKWKNFRKMDGGLPSVANVLISAIEDARKKEDQKLSYKILKRIYSITYPFWIVQYKKYGSLVASIGLIIGINPYKTVNWQKINWYFRFMLYIRYCISSIAGILTPVFVFDRIERYLKKIVT